MKRIIFVIASYCALFTNFALSQGVDKFTGSASYSLTLTPGVTLSYSSAMVPTIVTSENRDLQAGWVGAGWTLQYDYICVDLKGTATADDDEFFYVRNGSRIKIVKDGGGVLRPENNPYWRVDLTKSGDLVTGITITKDDGSKMKFGDFTTGIGTNQANRCTYSWGGKITGFSNSQNAVQICYEWDLSQTVDPYGVVLFNYYYYQEQVSLQVGNSGANLSYTRSSYIDHVTNNITGQTIKFVRGTRDAYEYQSISSNSYLQQFYQTLFLSSVQLLQNVNSPNAYQSWSFSYTLIQSGTTKEKKLLTSITQTDCLGNQLPSYSFTYSGAPNYLLSTIQAPSSGLTQFNYQNLSISYLNQSALLLNGSTNVTNGYIVASSGETIASYDKTAQMLHFRKCVGSWKAKDFQPSILPASGTYTMINATNDHIIFVFQGPDGTQRLSVYDWRNDIQDWQNGLTVAANSISGSYTKLMANISVSGGHVGLVAGDGSYGIAEVQEWNPATYSWINLGTASASYFPADTVMVNDDMLFFDHSDGGYWLQWKVSNGTTSWYGPNQMFSASNISSQVCSLQDDYLGRMDNYSHVLYAYRFYYNSSTGFENFNRDSLMANINQYSFAEFTDERILLCNYNSGTQAGLYNWMLNESGFSQCTTQTVSVTWGNGWNVAAQISDDWMFVLNYHNGNGTSNSYDATITGYLWNSSSQQYSLTGQDNLYVSEGGSYPRFQTAALLVTDKFLVWQSVGNSVWSMPSEIFTFNLDRTNSTSWISNGAAVYTDGTIGTPVTALIGSNFIGGFSNQTGATGAMLFHDVDHNWSNSISVYRVNQVTSNDEMGNSTSIVARNFLYDPSPAFDASLVFPMHSWVRDSLGAGQAGTTQTQFSNDLTQPRILGTMIKAQGFSNGGASPITSRTSRIAIHQDPSEWYLFQVRNLTDTILTDCVTKVVAYDYNDANGQYSQVSERVSVKSDLTGLRDRVTAFTYAYSQYPSMSTSNMLSQVFEKTDSAALNSVQTVTARAYSDDGTAQSDLTHSFTVPFDQLVTYSATGIQSGSVSIGTTSQGNQIMSNVINCSGSFLASKGTTYYLSAYANSFSYGHPYTYTQAILTVTYSSPSSAATLISRERTTYDSNGRPLASLKYDGANWITTESVVSRDSYGHVTQETNADGVYTSTIYGYGLALPIAKIANSPIANTAVSVFDDGNVSTWIGSYGTWAINNGVYQQTDGSSLGPWTIGGLYTPKYNTYASVGDGVFEADVRFDGGNYRFAGVVKYINNSNWVRFELRKWESTVKVETWKNGVQAVSSPTTFTFSDNQWYHLKGVVQGNTASLYIDGNLIMTFTNSNVQIGAGLIGLSTYYTAASFDNVRMYPLAAMATSTTYDPTTLQVTASQDENGGSTFYQHDGFGRATTAANASKQILTAKSYYYSPNFSNADPNFTSDITYTSPTGYSNFISSSGWTIDGSRVTFNIAEAGESTVRLGSQSGEWDDIHQNAGVGYTVARVDFYADNNTGGIPHVIAFNSSGNRFCVQWWPSTHSFVVEVMENSGPWLYPYTFALNAPPNQWYTVEIEKDVAGNCRAWTYRKGGARNYADTYSIAGFPSNWNADIYAWSNSNYFYLANFYVGNFSQTTTYADALGRTIQTQVRDGLNDLVSTVEYDAVGRAYRNWRPYDYSTSYRYDPWYSSHAQSIYGVTNPYVETDFKPDPLSRDSLDKQTAYASSNEGLFHDYGSATLSDGNLYQYYQVKQMNGNLGSDPWVDTRQYVDKLGRTIQTSMYAETGGGDTLTTTNTYNFLNEPVVQKLPKGDSVTYAYNFLGQLIRKWTPDEGGSRYIYDQAGRLRFMIDSAGLAANPNNVLYWKYDSFGRVIEKGYFNVAWGDGSTLQTYAYYTPTYPTTPTTWRKQYIYDYGGNGCGNMVGRLYQVLTNNNNSGADVIESFTYDRYGNIASVSQECTDFNSSTTYVTGYKHDLIGRVIEIDYPASWFPWGNVSVGYQYDQVGRVTQVGQVGGNPFANYTYDNKGQMATEVLNPNGGAGAQTRTFGYHVKGWLTSITNSLFTEQMTYDYGGNNNQGFYHGLMASDAVSYCNNNPTSLSYTFQYDNFGRLVVANNPSLAAMNVGANYPTTYDKNSNIKTMQRGTGSNQSYNYYPNTNELQNTGGSNYSYDVTGNMAQSNPNQSLQMTYDPFTQQTMSIANNNYFYIYEYGGAKQRIYSSYHSGGTTTQLLYLHGANEYPLMEKNGGNGTERVYIYGPTGLIAMYLNPASSYYYVHKDHLGSVRLLANGSGQMQSYYDYDVYGTLCRSSITTDISYRFTGQDYDMLSQLYNYKARLYDSGPGIFYAADPAHSTTSPYGYVGGNPVSFVDPTGTTLLAIGEMGNGTAMDQWMRYNMEGGGGWDYNFTDASGSHGIFRTFEENVYNDLGQWGVNTMVGLGWSPTPGIIQQPEVQLAINRATPTAGNETMYTFWPNGDICPMPNSASTGVYQSLTNNGAWEVTNINENRWKWQGEGNGLCLVFSRIISGDPATFGMRINIVILQNGKLTKAPSSERGLAQLEDKLLNGEAVVVGVNYYEEASINDNLATGHFVVIAGLGVDEFGNPYFRYFDPGTQWQYLGTNPNNRFYHQLTSGFWQASSPHGDDTYTLTESR